MDYMERPPAIRLEDLLSRMDQLRQSHSTQFHGQTSNAQKAFFLAHPLQSIQNSLSGAEENPGTRQQTSLLEIDNTLLARLNKSGHLTVLPAALGFEGSAEDKNLGNRAHLAMGHSGRIIMDTKDAGDLYGIPKTVHGERVEGKGRTFERWMVLLHEASHCQMENEGSVFHPTPGKLPEDQRVALSRWAFSPLATDDYPRKLLHENYADTYGAMLLLEATGHDPAAWDVVKRKREERFKGGKHAASDWQDFGDQLPVGPHLTWCALDEVIHKSSMWRGLPPEQLRARAMEFASNGVLGVLSDTYKTPVGIPLGRELRERIGNVSFSFGGVVKQMLAANNFGIQNHNTMRASMEKHPVLGAWDGILPQIISFLKETRETPLREMAIKVAPASWRERISSFSDRLSDIVDKVDVQAAADPVVAAHWQHDREALKRFGQNNHTPLPFFQSPDLSSRLESRRAAAEVEGPAVRPVRPS